MLYNLIKSQQIKIKAPYVCSMDRKAVWYYRNKETDNSRNDHSQKTMHTSYGDMEIDIHRDRKGEFEPQIVKKYQNTVTQDMEEKIISMYAKGMTTNDI